jgi:transcriptional regulator with XRE-family HTH domain
MSERGEKLGSSWQLLYRTGYTVMLGTRLRRIREGRHMTQGQAMAKVRKPQGGGYSQPLLSRIEAGYANAPLYVYLHLAEAYELDPARLLGPEEAEKPVGEAELALVLFLRRLRIRPDEAMARLARGLAR